MVARIIVTAAAVTGTRIRNRIVMYLPVWKRWTAAELFTVHKASSEPEVDKWRALKLRTPPPPEGCGRAPRGREGFESSRAAMQAVQAEARVFVILSWYEAKIKAFISSCIFQERRIGHVAVTAGRWHYQEHQVVCLLFIPKTVFFPLIDEWTLNKVLYRIRIADKIVPVLRMK